ncbi:cytochrome P450 [Piscinibacter gummiphilus]|uniref:Cytochrome P450 n=1 Tax=Piscinibacter gummiphilus TaxID=946333 RepID=A0ABZ0CRP0_9BURK|nr:cytochrome P450 [Piscinibacter gummiphilus]WOB07653.1 cytochrome P450 [Piscinibacter gummiphilus]
MSSRCPVHSDFDPLVRETFDSAHAQYAELRARCPVAHSDAYGGFWALTKYDDVARALSEPGTFVTSKQNVVPKVAFTGRRPPLHLDPPEHTPYRAVLNPLLTPERVAKLEPMVRRYAVELLDPMITSGEADICEAFGSHLPVRVFGHWMNLPPHLEQALSQAGPAFIRAVQSAQEEVMRETSLALYDMARALIDLRKQSRLDPAFDPTSALLAARHDGEPLPDDMVVGMVRQVLVVGIVAPMVMVGAMAVHLSRHPELQQQLRSDLSLVPAAVEEFLRLYTPYRGFARTATEDVEFRGRVIAKDEPIALLYASANRDEDVFPDPASFQLHRANIREHLAFGRGPHYCAGASLARVELQVALEELLSRTRHFELAGDIVMTPFPEIGPWRVPLRFTPA